MRLPSRAVLCLSGGWRHVRRREGSKSIKIKEKAEKMYEDAAHKALHVIKATQFAEIQQKAKRMYEDAAST